MEDKSSKLEFTDEQLKIVNDYCKDGMLRLKKICMPLITDKGVPYSEWDDMISEAMYTLIDSVKRYNPKRDCKFHTFFTGNIKRTYYDWSRDKRREKRCNYERNKDGTVKKDADGNPVIVNNLSLDATSEDGISLLDRVSSNVDVEKSVVMAEIEDVFRLEDKLLGKLTDILDEKIARFIQELPLRAQRIALLICQAYTKEEIKSILHIEEKQYQDALKIMKQTEFIGILY